MNMNTLKRQNRVLSGILEITHRCNLRCIHCYLGDHKNTCGDELSSSEFCNIIDQLYNLGALGVLITGGEPLMREDFADIYGYAYRKGRACRLFTNATLFDDNKLQFLDKHRPNELEVSIYSSTPEGYKRICGNSDAYYSMLDAVSFFVKQGFNVKLKSVIFKQNLEDLPGILNLVKDFGVAEENFRFDTQIYPSFNNQETAFVDDIRLSKDEVIYAESLSKLRILQRQRVHKIANSMNMTLDKRSPYLFTCGAGRTVVNVSPSGDISPCGLLKKYKWSVKEFDIKTIWDEKFTEFRELRRDSSSKCNDCVYWMMCSNCPAKAELETGDLHSCVSYYCENNLNVHKFVENVLL